MVAVGSRQSKAGASALAAFAGAGGVDRADHPIPCFHSYARPAGVDVNSLQKQVMARPAGGCDTARGQGLIPGADRGPVRTGP